MLFIITSNKVIGDLGENVFSEVVGVEARVQQDEDEIRCQEVEAANVGRSSIDKHPLCVNRLVLGF